MLKRAARIAKFGTELAIRRPKGWKSVLYNTALAKAKIAGPLMLPAHISIEPTNACNARCPVCETGNRSMERKYGMLDEKAFQNFIDLNADTTAVLMYYFMGEPFLNSKSYDMIRYAREKDIYVETCTNGDILDAEGLIYSDINQISFQIGGLSPESHGVYRIRSNFDKITKNIEALVELRNKTPNSNVQIEIGFIVMKHNEHEVKDFISWANGIGADKANIVDPCVRDVEEGYKYLPENKQYWFYDEEAFEKGYLKPKKLSDNECTWVWNSAMINWDGSVVPCCRDPHGRHQFGNAFEQPFHEIWNGQGLTEFRNQIVTSIKDVDICKLCSGFGIPQLERSRPLNFEVQRMSFDTTPVELPDEIEEDLRRGQLQ
ncbi:radical SAM/SPASM domain-containing protein [Kiloniella litopenaei]|uniref:radical SAM/SPASM domain-containing protein n=1 Tax=Kiloniella litopenaei TaxID=1549748 RepID=UPI0009E59ACB|nr:radical SAM protein [Kiloniella litopenaei]